MNLPSVPPECKPSAISSPGAGPLVPLLKGSLKGSGLENWRPFISWRKTSGRPAGKSKIQSFCPLSLPSLSRSRAGCPARIQTPMEIHNSLRLCALRPLRFVGLAFRATSAPAFRVWFSWQSSPSIASLTDSPCPPKPRQRRMNQTSQFFDKSPCIFHIKMVIPHSMKLRIITLGRARFGSSRSAGNSSACIRAGVPPADFAGPAPPADFSQGKSNENQTKSN